MPRPDKIRVAGAMVQGCATRYANGGIDEDEALDEIAEILAPLTPEGRQEALDRVAAVLAKHTGPGDEYVRPRAYAPNTCGGPPHMGEMGRPRC